jgi:hypothetical protein
MRRPLLPLVALVAAALVGCGDDPKQGSRGSPAGAPGATTPTSTPAPGSTPAAPPPAAPGLPSSPAPSPSAARPTRAGDWATWEVRVAGSESLTRITWRALRVEGDRVRFTVESRTTDAAGVEIASARAEEMRAAEAPRSTAGTAETVTVNGRPLSATTSREGEAEVTRSDEVPFGGLVRVRGPGGTTQTLVEYGRGG